MRLRIEKIGCRFANVELGVNRFVEDLCLVALRILVVTSARCHEQSYEFVIGWSFVRLILFCFRTRHGSIPEVPASICLFAGVSCETSRVRYR